ncbi:SUF system NifU family Fe-S cluster assembly protein [Humibacter sp. BT305]|uniref:Fe-S cluster assembly sulfur transfer protein SufU n=1 Tax=Cnuibacter physcomitrellae TaxID=1619308 RepID=UPI000E0C63B9|nr:SUF system NifU family Fe-S cluster assembly protein [Cnuibacter physcomitrellae]AXH35704.1 SUF system NifU family Fe-S cluster assembly protein [Humibacter sp. BT305]MCS5496624.1 SUF system NifU family Fe-S cluster assembly protein [Cnuibacter physcomitrellae]
MASSELQSLYQQVILDHSKERHGYGLRPDESGSSHQINPTCGDEVTLHVHRGADDVIESLSWEGQGCSISTASASLLHDLVQDLPEPEVRERIAAFRELMQSKGRSDGDEELLDDAVALAGVSRYVTRVKCAMLPWVALEHALG